MKQDVKTAPACVVLSIYAFDCFCMTRRNELFFEKNFRVFQVTSSEKSSGIEASIECSKKLIELGSKGTIECLALKGNRNEGGCIKIEGFESQISPPPNSNFRGSLEKLISGEANNCKSDDSRRKNRGSILVSSSKQGSFNKSILKALQEHQAFFSQDLEFGSQNLGDLSNSFQIVKGLTEDDGINIVEKRQLSILESESAAVIEQIRSFAKGRKEVELEIQKLDQGKKEMEKCYRMMESHGEYLKSEMTPAKIQEFYRSIEFLKSIFVEPENSRDVKLHEQKVRLEELEQQGRQGLHSLQQFINGLIYKFQELAGRDC
ncbi:uncharacterized protein LOC8289121 isoform X2 [Ricinus communis]|uniref:uncharacterized protein LOC8289121 isoform X2 n=1 Tax=Ricinus communis TaxID=3988 RepID=UPI00201AA634|nr:uncharacterized protein LOC8289121 isoform X2 [Ricinus communis]